MEDKMEKESKFDQMPAHLMYKNINGLIIFSNGLVINEDGVMIPHYLKKASRKSEKDRLLIYIGNQKYLQISRLVATLFVPNPQNKSAVRFKDGNVTNVDFRNLEWYEPKGRENTYKLSPELIRKALNHIDTSKLKKVHLAIYNYLHGEKRDFLSILYDEGNQRYFFKIVKNEFNNINSRYNINNTVVHIVNYFNDSIESLLLRGYIMPKEDIDDALFFIYCRNTLKGYVKAFFSHLPTRHKIMNGYRCDLPDMPLKIEYKTKVSIGTPSV